MFFCNIVEELYAENEMIIRVEKPEDQIGIRRINTEAFDTNTEANLIDALRKRGIPLISLVAEENGELVGHILFSPVTLEGDNSSISIAGLAPMAVAPAFQRREIGSMLVKEGLRHCKKAGYAAVVVLGHPDYYPRFGFVPSVNYGIKSELDVPAEVFMAKELREGALTGCTGIVKYHDVFNQV
jgi:putative acetyltransferase